MRNKVNSKFDFTYLIPLIGIYNGIYPLTHIVDRDK